MKLDQLRKIIREEVRAAVKEELQEMLTEAVKIASTPEKSSNTFKPVKQKDVERRWSTGRLNPGTIPLEEMLNDTKAQMTRDDFRNITQSGVSKPNFASMMSSQMVKEAAPSGPPVGLDLSQIPGLGKAKEVLDAAYKKDKNRVGV